LWQKKHNHWGPMFLDQPNPETPSRKDDSWITQKEPFRSILNWINPPPKPTRNPPCIMGKMAK